MAIRVGDMSATDTVEVTKDDELAKSVRLSETVIEALLFVAGAISILTTIGIVYVLVTESAKFFASPEVTFAEFITTTKWQPRIGEFGIWPLLNATFMVTGIAMLVALPLGLFSAIYLSEYASSRPGFRRWSTGTSP
jgi:phosphate transport system permease protein